MCALTIMLGFHLQPNQHEYFEHFTVNFHFLPIELPTTASRRRLIANNVSRYIGLQRGWITLEPHHQVIF